MREISNGIKYLPIRLLLGFLIFTELLFFVSPQHWDINNHIGLALYLALMNVALWAGYRHAVRCKRTINAQHKTDNTIVINWLLIASLPILLLQIYWTFDTLNPTALVESLRSALIDSGQAYSARNSQVNLTLYAINSLLSPIAFCALALGAYFWNKLSKKYKFILIVLVVLELSKWLAIGVRKGAMDLIITLSAGYLAGHYELLDSPRKVLRIIATIGCAIALFIAYFVISNLSRYSQTSLLEAVINYTPTGIYAKLPIWLLFPIYSISGYLCQGYYALAKALEIGFTQPNLLATNFFTINIAERFGINPLENSYMSILQSQFGIDPLSNWHSIYVWLANGFTFAGVPIFIYATGYLLGDSWLLSIQRRSLRAVPMFVILAQMIFYFFANNQIFSFAFPTIMILTLLYFSKIRL